MTRLPTTLSASFGIGSYLIYASMTQTLALKISASLMRHKRNSTALHSGAHVQS
ncbi:hypothetical protein JQ557_05920 [Bradyrhizobium sp. U87765 SZCCT0131]|uniref:hypothetical protein n=1 Tax=unclassified Bradyrhizobium TaxID=2631580 RepID=UPI001BAA9664|nr:MULTISPECIES: hypothetical protein [unclassified Bradyrhizobium]MBR1217514.1 hypothetical protein [Bradyrhizobium sp. U87765 SZCCT0131]MBR1264888.1 hypothetical protein [Bradyrhizobium sp. U87765 SZCCT0134]MBR1304870.1 hypothetical protein [Bradyrhizobium sp. U87765 SZCCT0110]MBR1320657.1 hypothetical protein [Bradyrhizobium sp. U87765 SZCCT0109]MBR1349077.1 hypothetical protein [Bradyrhizobium sp. U87765 SZCCT0048]